MLTRGTNNRQRFNSNISSSSSRMKLPRWPWEPSSSRTPSNSQMRAISRKTVCNCSMVKARCNSMTSSTEYSKSRKPWKLHQSRRYLRSYRVKTCSLTCKLTHSSPISSERKTSNSRSPCSISRRILRPRPVSSSTHCSKN